MPIRAIVIFLVVAVIVALIFREELYGWYKQATKKENEENTDDKGDEE